MVITNIYPENKVSKEMIRQPVELYLSFIILKNKEKYKFLKEKSDSYIILDNGSGDLQYTKGMPQGIDALLEAAEYVNANEIVLPDKLFSDESYDMTIEALKKIPENYNRNIAAVVHGSNIKNYLNNMENFVQNKRINTIMISKDTFLSEGLWKKKELSARLEATKELIKLFNKYNTKKQIHWLGGICMQEYVQIPKDIKKYIRSSDTGMYIAELSQLGGYNLKGKRPENFVIDLNNGNFEWKDVEKLIKDQKQIMEEKD